MRLMGKRQLGELQPSELVTTFMISNVASICIDEPDLPLLSSLVPILLIAALEILNSTAAYYLPGYAALLFGRPVTVIQDGQIRQDALRHLRMTPGDLMEALRGKDIFDPRQVVWGVVEPSGSISAAQKVADDSPLLPLLVDQEVYPEIWPSWGAMKPGWIPILPGAGCGGQRYWLTLAIRKAAL